MNSDLQQAFDAVVASHGDILRPETIEYMSVQKAFELAGQGQNDVANQIIDHLNLTADVKGVVRAAVHGKESTASSEMKTTDEVETESSLGAMPIPEPQPVFTPVPVPPAAAQLPETPPVPPGASSAVPTSESLLVVPTPESETKDQQPTSSVAIPAAPKPPVSEIPTVSDTIPTSPSMVPAPPPPPAPSQSSPQIVGEGENMPITDDLSSIVATVGDSEESHLGRLKTNKNLLESVIRQDRTEDEEELPAVYDKIFKVDHARKPAPKIPGVIKTYAQPQSVADSAEKRVQHNLDKTLNEAARMFNKLEEYLKKAYASHSETVIQSAERQFKNLRERYPEYVKHRPDHIDRLTKLSHAQQQMAFTQLESLDLGDVTLKPGMSVAGDDDVYVVSVIKQQEGRNRIVFRGKNSGNLFDVPARDVHRALQNEELDPDIFFKPFQQ